ncbi:sigma-70 family RNA polymerase sigma factor [Oharaeibacter diazotrophicus]|uniref:RNA polymerase sigma factor n=1 Tax=Oharaeibacter diazotrophicus TaxID=1920512 RepID=A0A4R6R922_9HYPH|nr:sigma-70 family RNA polymerase sigma factor [Oharaeibacter diazotrophicus]TDP82404.1 RNA polymerase sigma-70 factor (ECF subfamily) [Oharaeibacter diazotrophicus]BBE72833.1 ECF RNA polymerase sigma factor SigR [Pleomorphomonas sp. SM30]GLS76871.1 DNA-directed RNA polymerase sigma-70 factor [Oharaeibacter diazotrophicus]
MTEPTWDARREIAALIPALRAFARTLVRNPTDADDLVQETLAKGIANAHRFQPGTSLKSWLFTIQRNTFYTSLKISGREHPGAAGCVSETCVLPPTQEWSLRGLELREALDRLPPEQREVLILIGVLGVSYEEAAEICGCAVGTIKSRLNRARNRMLAFLEAERADDLFVTDGRMPRDTVVAA